MEVTDRINLHVNGEIFLLSNNSILVFNLKSASSYYLTFNVKAIEKRVCCINSPNFDNGIFIINGQKVLDLKLENNHNLVLGIISFVFKNLKHFDYFIIDSTGMDFKEVDDLRDFILLLSRQNIKIYFLIFKTMDNNFKINN